MIDGNNRTFLDLAGGAAIKKAVHSVPGILKALNNLNLKFLKKPVLNLSFHQN